MLYKVSGCGVSAICEANDSMLWIIERIIHKGGIPKIDLWESDIKPLHANDQRVI